MSAPLRSRIVAASVLSASQAACNAVAASLPLSHQSTSPLCAMHHTMRSTSPLAAACHAWQEPSAAPCVARGQAEGFYLMFQLSTTRVASTLSRVNEGLISPRIACVLYIRRLRAWHTPADDRKRPARLLYGRSSGRSAPVVLSYSLDCSTRHVVSKAAGELCPRPSICSGACLYHLSPGP